MSENKNVIVSDQVLDALVVGYGDAIAKLEGVDFLDSFAQGIETVLGVDVSVQASAKTHVVVSRADLVRLAEDIAWYNREFKCESAVLSGSEERVNSWLK